MSRDVEDLLAARPLPLREQLKVQLGLAASRANTFSPLAAATVGVGASVRSRSWPQSVGSPSPALSARWPCLT